MAEDSFISRVLGDMLVCLSASTPPGVRQRPDDSDILEIKNRVGLTHAVASLLKVFVRVSRRDIRLDGVEDTMRRDPRHRPPAIQPRSKRLWAVTALANNASKRCQNSWDRGVFAGGLAASSKEPRG